MLAIFLNHRFIFLTFSILLFIAVGAFFLLKSFNQDSRPFSEPAMEQTVTKGAESGQSELLEEETIQRAKEAIALAEQVIVQAQQLLAEQEKSEPNSSKTREQGRKETGKQGENVKGVYMTGPIAVGQGVAERSLRDSIKNLVLTTELNAIVIDVKEASGPYVSNSLVQFLESLHQNNIWTIARIVTFADASLVEERPELYLKSKSSRSFWQDLGGRYWLDPASKGAQDYIIQFSKQIIDLGFDELQYDYLRFPTDGNLVDISYPVFDGRDKEQVLAEFFSRLSKELRAYKSDIVLSIDLFGLVALKKSLPEIGQNIADSARYFDYLSFMLYPSHFYGGFEVPADPARGLPALHFPYKSADINQVVSNRPYEVVYRSLLFASDYIDALGASAGLRPFLQDFSLKFDTNRGIIYDAEKVRIQIKAAKDAGASGWLLWNPKNVYTKEALLEIP